MSEGGSSPMGVADLLSGKLVKFDPYQVGRLYRGTACYENASP